MPDLPEFRALREQLSGETLAFYPLASSQPANQLPAALCGEQIEGLVGWGLNAARRREVLKRPGLKWVLTLTAGIDGWLSDLPPEVAFYNAHDLHDGAVAQHAAATLLATGRGLARFARAQTWSAPSGPLWTLSGRRVVVWGYGQIGRKLHALLSPFGAQVTGLHSRSTPQEVAAALAQADDVVLLLPLTPHTRGLVNKAVLAQLQPGAWLHNFGRGELVVTGDLLAALDAGQVGGAVLDVTDPEPLPAGHELWQRPNVLITPHIASTTQDLPYRAAQYAANFIQRLRRSETLSNRVDLNRGY